MLAKDQIEELRKELECKRPLFLFDDDPDGLCSFLLLYRYVKEGKGVIVKSEPKIDEKFVVKVRDYEPDKVFILDIPIVEQDFIDDVKQKIIWIDHHPVVKRQNIRYFNPRLEKPDANFPTSAICYQIVQNDLWIATAGCVADWVFPDFAKDFSEKYPDLLPENIKDAETAMFKTELGKLIKVLGFVLKGKTHDVIKCMKVLTRIKDPYEILKQKTPAGRFIYKRYKMVNEEYEELLKRAPEPKNGVLLFSYYGKISFTKNLSNELLHKHPDDLIIVAREKDDEMKCSLRSRDLILPKIIKKALKGVEGYGGGHEHACGSCINKKDFKTFLKNIEEQIATK